MRFSRFNRFGFGEVRGVAKELLAIAGVRAIRECMSSFSGGSGNIVGISTLKEMGEPSTFFTVLKVDSFSAEAWHLRQYNPKPESG